MVVKLQFIEQELIGIKTEQKKCRHLLENQKNLEEEVLHLKSWMRESEVGSVKAGDRAGREGRRFAESRVACLSFESVTGFNSFQHTGNVGYIRCISSSANSSWLGRSLNVVICLSLKFSVYVGRSLWFVLLK